MRVLAITADASLQVALASMMPEWEVLGARDAERAAEAARHAAVALVDFGTTERGMQAAEALAKLGLSIPCLVIGDAEAPAGSKALVLLRPFTLGDLTEAVSRAAEPRAEEVAPARAEEAPAEACADIEVTAPPAAQDMLTVPEVDAPPAQARAEEQPSAEVVEQPAFPESASPEPISVEIVPPEPEAPEPEASEPGAPESDAPVAAEPEPPKDPMEYARQLFAELGDLSSPEPVKPPAPPAPARLRPEPVVHRTLPPRRRPAAPQTEILPGRGRLRGLLRRKSGETPPAPAPRLDAAEHPLFGRLRAAIGAGDDLESLLEQMPALARPRALAHAFLTEVVELFGPQIAAVYAPGPDGRYHVIAPHGLSHVEADLKVPADQPLFREVAAGLQAVLISPVDLAQGLVAGIGGARTEALMVAPLESGGKCHAIAIAGRREFAESDLARFVDLAREAAPGLAVANLVERLRAHA